MKEVEILRHAKQYLEKMAKGINPLTDQSVPQTDLIVNARISKCLAYVSSILQKEISKVINEPQIKLGSIVYLLDRENDELLRLKILSSYDSVRYKTMGYKTKKYAELEKTSDADGFTSISNDSPVGKAIIGKRAGEEVSIPSDGKVLRYSIMHVSNRKI